MGVVYHANYLIWMEVGRVEYWRAAGPALSRHGARRRHPAGSGRGALPLSLAAVYDEEVIVRTSVAEASPRMIRFEYELLGADDGRRLATGYTKHVFCGSDRKTGQAAAKISRDTWDRRGLNEHTLDSRSGFGGQTRFHSRGFQRSSGARRPGDHQRQTHSRVAADHSVRARTRRGRDSGQSTWGGPRASRIRR